jgi:flavin reductase (DIM6/NTAB) family NADH-FMN oxidoreductase RutF
MTSIPQSTHPSPLNSNEFRNVMGHFATGVTVVTTRHDGKDFGTTASAVSSVSLEPPMLLVCMNRSSLTGQAVTASQQFAINILRADQRALAERFASKQPRKLAPGDTTDGAWGQPLLRDAIAAVECRVVEQIAGGTHVVFIAQALGAEAPGGEPLAYFRGRFGRLELDAPAAAATA